MEESFLKEDLKKQEEKEEEKEEKKENKTRKQQKSKKQEDKNDEQQELNNKELEKEEENNKNDVENRKFNKVDGNKKKIEKDMKLIDKKKGKNKKIIAILISIPILLILFVLSIIFSVLNINNENLISGISIEGIDVSGLSKKEAMDKIQQLYEEKKQKEIGVRYEDYESSLNPTLMEVTYDIEKSVDEAYLIGRNSNIFVNNYNILFTLLFKKDINVNMSFNEETTRQLIEDMGINLPGVIIESSYSREEDKLIITKGKEGVYIDTENLLNKVKEDLNNIKIIQDDIDIPVINKTPQEIDIDKIHEEIYTEVKDAYYTKDPFTIYPEVEGVDFDVEAAKAILQEDKEEYEIPLVITKPKVTINDIGTEAFPDKLATYTTRYDASDKDRTTNLVIACKKINGKVVLTGETFSYNNTLGARTVAAGYKNAKVYENGEVVDGIGGGICQISSTLYNAVLMSNLQIVERRNHQFVTSYAPPGRDATVVYGMTDFKFKNTRKYPIRIVASAQNGIATVSVYGIKEENEYTFSFSTKTIASIPFTTKYIEDSTLAAGTEKVKQKGANGIKTETYITKMLNGKAISTTLLSRDTYDAMNRIVIKSTKGTKNTTNTNSQQKDTNTNNNQSQPAQNNKDKTTLNNNPQNSNQTTGTGGTSNNTGNTNSTNVTTQTKQ